MNLSRSAFRRYKVIDELLRNKYRKYPKMEDIIDACREKLHFEPTRETIQKDIAHMKAPSPNGFDAPIYFNRFHHGYEYTDPNYCLHGIQMKQEEMDALLDAVDLIREIGNKRVSNQLNHAIEKLVFTTLAERQDQSTESPTLQLMQAPTSRGFELFDFLWSATKNKHVLSFVYFSYESRQFDAVILHPFLIKEFENRWYILGYSERKQTIQTFGFDHISDPLIIDTCFIPIPKEQLYCLLYEQYGVTPINSFESTEITVRADQLSTYYFQAFPIHSSQHIHKFSSGSSTITFQLIPTVELANYLLSRGNSIQIIGPKDFRDFVFSLKK